MAFDVVSYFSCILFGEVFPAPPDGIYINIIVYIDVATIATIFIC